MRVRIAIIGAGAMGSLFGGKLVSAGHDVWLYDIWQDHVDKINRDGLVIASAAGETTVRPRATTDSGEIGSAELLIVFVKATATRTAAKTAATLMGPDSVVLTLQNGYGNAEKLAEAVGQERVLAGVTSHGATMLGPGHIRHAGSGETHIGQLNGGISDRTRRIAALMTDAGIVTTTDGDVASLIWGKLLINVGINALTAITGLKNGQLNDYEETRELMRLVVDEAEHVAKATGIKLPYADSFAKVAATAQATAENKSSMLQDISNHRLTEIDVINGAVVNEGKRLGIATPVNQALTLIVHTLEKCGNR